MNKLSLLTIMTFSLAAFASAASIEIGSAAPKLSATTHAGDAIDLGTLYNEGPVLVYFYPKADTPGCTAQACNLRDHFDDIQKAGITVIGVSSDKPEAQNRFREKYELPFTLIADTEGEVAEGFGVPRRFGFTSRQSFLVIDGKIAWRDLKAKPGSQTKDVLNAYRMVTGS